MIGRLRGTLAVRQPPALVIDVQGVGYELEAPMSTFYALPALGEEVILTTHLGIRDEVPVLFGFAREAERALFRRLLKVSGVGARMALAILSGMSVEEFAATVEAGDVASLQRLPGVGRKTAERLVLEMREALPAAPAEATAQSAAPGGGDPEQDALSALIALGYRPQEAQRAIRSVAGGQSSGEELIRLALRSMVGNGGAA